MKKLAVPAILALLSACAPVVLQPGEPESAVLSKLGQPTNRYQLGNSDSGDRGVLLEYAHGPFGQVTYMANIGPEGTLRNFEQVLTSGKFAAIEPGVANKYDVLRLIGAPGDTSPLELSHLQIWSYPYKQDNVWDAMMHVHFDRDGVVRKMMNGWDPHRPPDD